MESFVNIIGSLDPENKLEMAIYHECLRLQNHLAYYRDKDEKIAAMYGMMAISLGGILLEKTGRMTNDDLNQDNNEFNK